MQVISISSPSGEPTVLIEKNHRILIVDDNESIHEDFRKILAGDPERDDDFDREEAEVFKHAAVISRHPEFELSFASQGAQALGLVEEFKKEGRPFSLAFVDVRMPPGWDGLKTTAKLWDADPDLQIVICTAYSDKSWEEMSREFKHPERVLILKKPFDTIEVLQLAHALTEKWSLLQKSRRNMRELETTVQERTRELMASNARLEQETASHKTAAEQVLEQAMILEKARDAIIVRDLDDAILFWNQGAANCYGWTAREALGRTTTDLLVKEPHGQEDVAARQAVLDQGHWNGELTQTTKDGLLITTECRCTLLRDAEGTPKSILSINNDITERKSLEQQFLRAQRMESIGTLAGGIAHDLNNVLAPIMMSIDNLRTHITHPSALEMLDLVGKSAQRGANLVSQVLTYARGVDGKFEDVDLAVVVRDLMRIVEETFPKDIKIEASINDKPWPVKGDPTQIQQVLLNLCVNARDAMPQGGRICLNVENTVIDAHYTGMNVDAEPGSYLKIEVTDTGHGIPNEIFAKIFDPFFTTKEVGRGTGLGLSTSQAIIKGHRGFINAHNMPGMGACFRIHIPATRDISHATLDQPDDPPPRGDGETVLVVDDEPAIRQITQQTLESYGYKVLLASDGSEAIAVYLKHRDEIDIVLTDMMMPVMDGPETIRVLQRLCPGLPIIGASGINSQGKMARAVHAGVAQFLPKPYSASTLLKCIRDILAQETEQFQIQTA